LAYQTTKDKDCVPFSQKKKQLTQNLVGFRVSEGWIRNLKSGMALSCMETLAQPISICHNSEVGLPKLLQGADTHDVYNMDETGFNYQSIPKRMLASQSRKGIKQAKDQITLLCASMLWGNTNSN
jgi:hypothetical protein